MHTTVKKLLRFGTSRQEICNKLRRMGFIVDQSTIAKWEKSDKPGKKMLARITEAVELLEKSSSFELFISDAQELGEFLQSIQCMKISGRKIAEYDLLPIFRALANSEIDSFKLSEFSDLLAFSAARGDFLSPEQVPELAKLLRKVRSSE